MFTLKRLLFSHVGFHTYFWVDVALLKETPKAILIMFNEQKNWLPKAWIVKIKRTKIVGAASGREQISIKISEYYWSKKFA